jgi:hypothetical protein
MIEINRHTTEDHRRPFISQCGRAAAVPLSSAWSRGHESRRNLAYPPLQCCVAAATVIAGFGTKPRHLLAGNKNDPGPPNHAHRAEVSLVAPSTRVSGLGGNWIKRPLLRRQWED